MFHWSRSRTPWWSEDCLEFPWRSWGVWLCRGKSKLFLWIFASLTQLQISRRNLFKTLSTASLWSYLQCVVIYLIFATIINIQARKETYWSCLRAHFGQANQEQDLRMGVNKCWEEACWMENKQLFPCFIYQRSTRTFNFWKHRLQLHKTNMHQTILSFNKSFTSKKQKVSIFNLLWFNDCLYLNL